MYGVVVDWFRYLGKQARSELDLFVLEQRGKAMRSTANRQGACEAGRHRGHRATPRHPLGKLSRQATSGVIAVAEDCGTRLRI
jgi:hypothetical protein